MMDEAAVPDAEAEITRNWQARGVESDRLTKRMRGLMLLIAAGLLVWLVVQLA